MTKAVWRDTVIAESDHTITIEGNHYFPPDSVQSQYLKPSNAHTVCPRKGVASYGHIEVDGERNTDAAWYYTDPSPATAQIKNYVAFWKGVRIEP